MLESFQQAKTPSEMSRSWKLAAKRQIDLLFLFVGFVVAHFPRCCTIPITARQCSASNFPRGSWLQNPWPDPVWWHEKFCPCQQASNGQMAFSLRSVIISSFEPVLSPPGVDRFPITFFCYRAYTPNPIRAPSVCLLGFVDHISRPRPLQPSQPGVCATKVCRFGTIAGWTQYSRSGRHWLDPRLVPLTCAPPFCPHARFYCVVCVLFIPFWFCLFVFFCRFAAVPWPANCALTSGDTFCRAPTPADQHCDEVFAVRSKSPANVPSVLLPPVLIGSAKTNKSLSFLRPWGGS